MSEPYTPSFDEVRKIYVEATEGHREDDPDEAARVAEFDRWLQRHDSEVWEDGAANYYFANPYRSEGSDS